MELLGTILDTIASFIWNLPLLVLLIGGGAYFLIFSRFIPFKFIPHAIQILRGKHSEKNEKGQITHFQALTSALSATVGMGNIGGIAFAISIAGPGVLFWMWMSALVGMATKYFTCSLAIMYRGKDANGKLDGGPMYVISKGLGKKWKSLAFLFCAAGMIGCLPLFQANQLTEVVRENIFIKYNLISQENIYLLNIGMGILVSALVYLVVLGGIKRIAKVSERLVPTMVVLYMLSVMGIIFFNIDKVPECFALIFNDAFTGDAVAGGVLGYVIISGIRRAAFSNEAGVGTAPMAHGVAKTNNAIKEGLVAMLGPAIDTLIVCTCTGLAILITGVWLTSSQQGIALTADAFSTGIPYVGEYILIGCAVIFAITSLFTFAYYGNKCFLFLFPKGPRKGYYYFYIATVFYGTLASISSVISLIDISFALMAIPTVISAIALSPKVLKETKKYIQSLRMV